jgi:hypothetical protein
MDEICLTGIPGALAMRQQVIKSVHRMFGDTTEHVAEPDKGVDLHQFAGSNKAAQVSRCRATGIAPEDVLFPRPTAKHRNDLSVPLLSMARSPLLSSIPLSDLQPHSPEGFTERLTEERMAL